MASYFIDSSALLKRYVVEAGSSWVASLFHPAGANQLSVASITGAEIVAAITRRSRGGGLPAPDALRITSRFRSDFQADFDVVEVDLALITSAMDLAQRHGLRGYDAVQLAVALAVNITAHSVGTSITLVSADAELNAAAVAEGLTVDDPNKHR